MDADLHTLSLTGLLNLYSKILQEFLRRKVCRSTNNPVADIAELLVIEALSLTRAAKSTKGYDAVDASGKRYEIKARRVTADNPSRMLSAIRDCEARHFDYLAGVLFCQDFSFDRACLVPFDIVQRRSTYRKYINAHIFELRDELWNTDRVIDISSQIAGVLVRLDAAPTAPTRHPPEIDSTAGLKHMFELGTSYSREDIHALVGGSLQSYLPHVGGRVVAACLRLDRNPDAPAVILSGKGPGIEGAAALLAEQRTPVPTFLKRGPAKWEYVGKFLVDRCSRDLAEIAAQARRSGRADITMVLYMKPAGP